jgi:hypothetical protein
MSFTQAGVNDYNFSEVTESDKQVLVTNGLGRTAKYAELVYLGGYFGEVKEYSGIANAGTGRININSERLIRTKQVKATTTFTVGQPVYFLSGGSSAAGELYGVATLNAIPVGVCVAEEGTGGAQTAVTFRPYTQGSADAKAVTQVVYKVTTGAAAIVVPTLKQGDEIIDVMIIPTGASTNGTIKITDGTSDITNAMTCAVDKTIARASTIDDAKSTLPAAGATIVCAGDTVANTKAIVVFTIIPA